MLIPGLLLVIALHLLSERLVQSLHELSVQQTLEFSNILLREKSAHAEGRGCWHIIINPLMLTVMPSLDRWNLHRCPPRGMTNGTYLIRSTSASQSRRNLALAASFCRMSISLRAYGVIFDPTSGVG